MSEMRSDGWPKPRCMSQVRSQSDCRRRGAARARGTKRTFDSKGPRCSGCTFRTECAKDTERSLCPRSAKSQCASGVVKSEYLGARSI